MLQHLTKKDQKTYVMSGEGKKGRPTLVAHMNKVAFLLKIENVPFRVETLKKFEKDSDKGIFNV